MQFLVPAHLHDIVAVEKPIDLFPGEHEQALTRFRPAEFLLSQCLVVEDEAIVFPHQALDLVAPAVGEGVERAVKGIMAQLLFHQHREAMRLLAEVDRITVQIDLRDLQCRA